MLIGLDIYNLFPNIDSKNNCNAYEYDDSNINIISSILESSRYIITLPTGSYEISAINNYIQEQLKRKRPRKLF